jgi:hypothetical protein
MEPTSNPSPRPIKSASLLLFSAIKAQLLCLPLKVLGIKYAKVAIKLLKIQAKSNRRLQVFLGRIKQVVAAVDDWLLRRGGVGEQLRERWVLGCEVGTPRQPH